MFYCKECADKAKWPVSPWKSEGKCEVCGRHAECNDTPSYRLPDQFKDGHGNDST